MDAEGNASQTLEENVAEWIDLVDVGGECYGNESDARAQSGYVKGVTGQDVQRLRK